MVNPKVDGLGREFENLCKQRRGAKLVYIDGSKNANIK